MKLSHHGFLSPYPSLHYYSSSLGLSIIDALKLTKSKRRFKYDFTIIYFDNIDVCAVKHLRPFFNGGVLFVLLRISMGVPSTYGHTMNDMDNMYDAHPWCTTKTKYIKKMDFLLSVLLVLVICSV